MIFYHSSILLLSLTMALPKYKYKLPIWPIHCSFYELEEAATKNDNSSLSNLYVFIKFYERKLFSCLLICWFDGCYRLEQNDLSGGIIYFSLFKCHQRLRSQYEPATILFAQCTFATISKSETTCQGILILRWTVFISEYQ